MRTTRKGFVIAWIALVIAVILVDFISRSCMVVHFGKDGGMVFRISMFLVSCSILFGYIGGWKSRSAMLGVAIGMAAQVCAYAALILSSRVKGDFSGWDIPLVWDQLIAAGFLLLFGIGRNSFRFSKSSRLGQADN